MIPAQGSVGASGDLAPLAHLALALIGEGEVFVAASAMAAPRRFAGRDLRRCSCRRRKGWRC